jgi:hypothetical protein
MRLVATDAFCINLLLSALEKTFTIEKMQGPAEVTGNPLPLPHPARRDFSRMRDSLTAFLPAFGITPRHLTLPGQDTTKSWRILPGRISQMGTDMPVPCSRTCKEKNHQGM